jgi:hypothetical protein
MFYGSFFFILERRRVQETTMNIFSRLVKKFTAYQNDRTPGDYGPMTEGTPAMGAINVQAEETNFNQDHKKQVAPIKESQV